MEIKQGQLKFWKPIVRKSETGIFVGRGDSGAVSVAKNIKHV